MGKTRSPLYEFGLPGQLRFVVLCCFRQSVKKIVRDMLGDEDQWPYTRNRSSPVAPVTAIIILPPGVKLSEFDAFRFSPPASDENNPIDDDTPPGGESQ